MISILVRQYGFIIEILLDQTIKLVEVCNVQDRLDVNIAVLFKLLSMSARQLLQSHCGFVSLLEANPMTIMHSLPMTRR